MRRAIFFLFLFLTVQIPFLAEEMYISANDYLSASDSITIDTIPADTIPADTIPADTIPADTMILKLDTINKVFKQDMLTRGCLPFPIDTTQIAELFLPARIDENEITIFPVSHVASGQPFIGRPRKDIDQWLIADSLTDWSTPDQQPLMWNGGSIQGNYSDFSWIHTTFDEETDSLQNAIYHILDPNDLHFDVNLENLQVRRFLKNVHYTDSTPSMVTKYKQASLGKGDTPNPVSIPLPLVDTDSLFMVCVPEDNEEDSITKTFAASDQVGRIYNLIPQRTYRYCIYKIEKDSFTTKLTLAGKGSFFTEGRIRMIHAPNAKNIRDLGGWETTDHRRIKYGLLFRGGELNGQHSVTPEGLQALYDIGIQAEIDLRGEKEEGAGTSAFNFSDDIDTSPDGLITYYFTYNSGCELQHMSMYKFRSRWKNEINYIVDNLLRNRPVYYHCIWGADRTGALSMLIQGVLGISYDQIAKDYELTSFTGETVRLRESQYKLISYINGLAGNTLQEKFNTFLTKNVGLNQWVIDYLTETLLEEEEEVILTGIKEHKPVLMPKEEGYYNLSGRQITGSLPKGVYIKIHRDGIGRKYIQK